MLRRIVGPKRRPDDWTTPHERALVRLSDRMDGLLDADEARWLDAHLADCSDCRSAATAYDQNRTALKSLPRPEPPRDLFARTMAAIESEEAQRRRRRDRGAGATARRLAPYGALGSVLIVALVVGATAFAPVTQIADLGDVQATPRAAASESLPSASVDPASPLPPDVTPPPPEATPIVVPDAAPVGYATVSDDGSYAVTLAPITEVCAPEAAPDCAPITTAASAVVTIDVAPAIVVGSPAGGQIVVADAGTRQGGGSVYALALPGAGPVEPGPSPSIEATEPPATGEPSTPPSVEPITSPEPSASPTIEPSPSAQALRLAILDDVVLVGESAAYSPSGAWFAFTARPPDGSQGPDVYVWRPDWPSARPLTTDHRSVFGSWLGESVLASRPEAGAGEATAEATAPETFVAETVVIDPESGAEQPLAGAAVWRPSVDPSGRFAVYWEGTVATDPSGIVWRPADGRLVIARFDASADPVVTEPVTLVDEPVPGWDARWDEHGGRVALWIADPEVAGIGELSAYALDPSTGVDLDDPLLSDVLALSGFTIGHGRLAWATPPGQGGEGSKLEVLAWVGPDKGLTKSDPARGDAPVIVVR